MNKTLILSAITLFSLVPGLFAQTFDFKLLDKIGASAKSSTNVTLDGDMLKLASGFLGGEKKDKDAAAVQSLVANLKALYIREWEFAKPGQYTEADLEPLRNFLHQPQWKAILDVREDKESTQIYTMPLPDSKMGGFVLVSSEPTEVTVIYIDGILGKEDLAKLSGNMGLPDLKKLTGGAGDKKAGK